jgi:hypothetical protein
MERPEVDEPTLQALEKLHRGFNCMNEMLNEKAAFRNLMTDVFPILPQTIRLLQTENASLRAEISRLTEMMPQAPEVCKFYGKNNRCFDAKRNNSGTLTNLYCTNNSNYCRYWQLKSAKEEGKT